MPTKAPSATRTPDRRRLLIVNSTLHIGGAEQVAASLAKNGNSRFLKTAACYLKQPGLIADQMLRDGVDLVPVPGLMPGRQDYFTFIKLRRLIRQRKIEVIHTHDLHGLIDGCVCRLTTPNLKLVHTFHYGNYPQRKLRHKAIEFIAARIADALIAVSHNQCAAIRKLYRVPQSRIRVIWNGVEEPHPAPGGRNLIAAIPAGVPIIASVSTLIPQKGLEFLLEAAASLNRSGEEFALVIAGDGRLREKLTAIAEDLGLQERVHFLGWVSDAASRVLPKCDIFVQSSLWEAMSVVVLEAMAAGKPVVATSVGENENVIVKGRTGLIVTPGKADELAGALRALLRDSKLRETMGRAGRKHYQSNFTVRHMIAAHEELYLRLTGLPR